MATNATMSAPFSWAPSSYWDGNDGLWNTFILRVGTPAQDFRILPSTAGQEPWIPVPDACLSISPSDPGYCGYLRGTLPVDGTNSSGFASNKSSTWDYIGLFTLQQQEAALGYGGNGNYGWDTVVWGNDSNSPNLTHQVAGGIADPAYWLGLVGIGPKTINFTTFNDPIPSYLSNLVNQSIIPSHSWGYTAGASYRNRSQASLTLGGYDTNRFDTGGLSVLMNADDSRPLQVGVQRIIAENTLQPSSNLLPTSTFHFLDSTVPHIWLPDDAIDAFISAFGLEYDHNTDLFLVNDTIHSRLLDLNPSITFVLGESTNSAASDTINIKLPYAAFDLQASYPFYQNATNYFPIRRASNDTQYTIGRTFFQESYVIADFERSNFTIAQAAFDNLDQQHLVAVQKVPVTATPTPSTLPNASAQISDGAVAGIVIGVIVVLALVGILAWFLIRRKREQKAAAVAQLNAEKTGIYEAGSDETGLHKKPFANELPNENSVYEAEGQKPAQEADSNALTSEVDGRTATWGAHGVQELRSEPVGHESGRLVEAPGSEGLRYEMPADEEFRNRVK